MLTGLIDKKIVLVAFIFSVVKVKYDFTSWIKRGIFKNFRIGGYMLILNYSVLIVSIFLIISLGVSALVWGTKWYTYPSKTLRSRIEPKSFRETGGFLRVIRGYKVYTRKKGKSGGYIEASPLRGFILGCSLSCLILLVIFLILLGLRIRYHFVQNISVWIFSFSLSLVLIIVFPDLFTKFARLPSRVIDLPQNAPLSLMWWGILMSLYGIAVCVKYTGTFDLIKWAKNAIPYFKNIGELGLPIVWFIVIASLSPFPLADLKLPRSIWYIFWTSWVIDAIACEILGLFLVVYNNYSSF
jgi:hypothetical protein